MNYQILVPCNLANSISCTINDLPHFVLWPVLAAFSKVHCLVASTIKGWLITHIGFFSFPAELPDLLIQNSDGTGSIGCRSLDTPAILYSNSSFDLDLAILYLLTQRDKMARLASLVCHFTYRGFIICLCVKKETDPCNDISIKKVPY